MTATATKRKHPLAECEKCPLAKAKCAPTSGPADAKVAIVSRSPGYYDTRAKRPFAGPSGKILDHLLGLYGHKREDVLATNIVLCQYDGTPPKEAINACKPRLYAEIENADTVIAAGSEAVALLTGRKSMDGTRGYAHKRRATQSEQRVICTNNPAIVLRDDTTFPNLVRDFRLALAPLPQPKLPTVRWTNDKDEARKWLETILRTKADYISVDIESKGLRRDAPLVAIGFSASGSQGVSFGDAICEDRDFVAKHIRPVLARRDTNFVYHNGKFDVRNLRHKGIDARVDEDTLLLSWALDERSDEGQVHKLEYLLMNELGWPNYEPPEVVQWKRTVSRLEKELKFAELDALPTPDSLYEYNALDVCGTAQIFPILRERAIGDAVWERPYRNLLLPASNVLVRVEEQGIPYDTEKALDLLEEEVWPTLARLRTELQWIVGDGNYNPNSPQQNAKLVYDDWKILHNLPLKNERTVDKSVYTEIKAGRFIAGTFDQRNSKKAENDGEGGAGDVQSNPRDIAIRWAEKYAEFKALDKQRSTYLEGLIPGAIHNGGRIYTNFKLHNTVTGRLSSSSPNLQNITRPKPGLPNIRSLFVAEPGRKLVSADYSQAELRTLAELSGDKNLGDVYRKRHDLHDVTATRFYGSAFTYEQRSRAKNMNFGVPYGQSAQTFQEKHDIPEHEAEKFIEWWFANFSDVAVWRKEVGKQVTGAGEVISPFGHKRRFHLITKDNYNAVIREGINFLPQNIAANFTLYSILQLADIVDWVVAPIVLTVHDSILLNVDMEHVHDMGVLLRDTMIKAPVDALGWDFPFDADIQVGDSWGTLQDYELETAV